VGGKGQCSDVQCNSTDKGQMILNNHEGNTALSGQHCNPEAHMSGSRLKKPLQHLLCLTLPKRPDPFTRGCTNQLPEILADQLCCHAKQ
jgi:hypothetical protein